MRRYTKTHEWILLNDDDTAVVGITERLILANGKIAFIELPEIGAEYEMEEPVGAIETREGVEILYRAPVSGEVIGVNDELDNEVSFINASPEEDGWIFKLRVDYPDEVETLMTDADYEFYEEDEEDDEYDEDEY